MTSTSIPEKSKNLPKYPKTIHKKSKNFFCFQNVLYWSFKFYYECLLFQMFLSFRMYYRNPPEKSFFIGSAESPVRSGWAWQKSKRITKKTQKNYQKKSRKNPSKLPKKNPSKQQKKNPSKQQKKIQANYPKVQAH